MPSQDVFSSVLVGCPFRLTSCSISRLSRPFSLLCYTFFITKVPFNILPDSQTPTMGLTFLPPQESINAAKMSFYVPPDFNGLQLIFFFKLFCFFI